MGQGSNTQDCFFKKPRHKFIRDRPDIAKGVKNRSNLICANQVSCGKVQTSPIYMPGIKNLH